MKENCNMHIHTYYSDGTLSGTELLEYAAKCGLKKLSITDHDCVDFYFDEEAMNMLKHFDYVTGCEFVCAYEDVPIEILGYGIDVKKAKEYLDVYGVVENTMERYRSDNIPRVFAKHGIILDYDPNTVDFTQKCPMALEKIHEVIINDPKAVEFLNKENPNLVKSVSAFLREGISNPKSKIFIAPHKLYPSYDKITTIIKKLGGISFLAHPYQYGNNMARVLEGVKGSVDGVECYHYTTREQEKTDALRAFCEKNSLMISGGSDFHVMSDTLTGLNIPGEYFDKVKAKLNVKKVGRK